MRVTYTTLVLLGLGGTAWLTSPPVKMGLWEVTSTYTMQGSGKMAPGDGGAAKTMTQKMCLTEETWEKSLGGQGPVAKGCSRANVVSTSQMMSGTLSCTIGSVSMVTDQKTYFDSSEKVHGTAHLASDSPSGKTVSDSTVTAKWLSSDCGDVKPPGQMRRSQP